jgi:hypothetical protein
VFAAAYQDDIQGQLTRLVARNLRKRVSRTVEAR